VKIVIADKLPQHHSTEVKGMPVIIEWPDGSTRVGTRPDGTTFKTEMKGVSYGYIPDTTGRDKEKLDVYIGPDKDSEYAYIVEQLTLEGEFDEYKVMLCFSTLEDAEEAYIAQAGEDLLGDISEVKFEYLFDTVKEKQKEAAKNKAAVKLAAGERFTVIEAFLKNYKHEVDFYDEVAHLVQDKLDQALQEAGIKAVVSSRAKTPDRLRKKLYKRDKSRHYQTFRDIDDDIIDLAGCRVALYMPADRDAVGKIIEELFVPVRPPKNFPESSKPEDGDTLGYVATHYLVRLRPETLRKKELRYADTQIEIQVASILMHSWAEISHDLLYKPEKGELTSEEKAALANLNKLVQEGERQLETLQSSMENRTEESLRFEIAAALAKSLTARSMGKTASLTLGDVEKAARAFIGRKKSLWSTYIQAAENLRKARWQKPEVSDEEYRKKWESAGVSGNETHYIQEAMAKLAPGKQVSTLWVLPNRSEIIAEAQRLKTEATKNGKL
jgi:ppGpp synthetase/RelA/SpoT-type nucleotidyltranferase